ncbi:MAG: ABC-F family ATP-binding cassette domain-containing protein [Actinomycetia bacterium]|nr:ABC-F family ATP-binding cassette domain-containing protein [Actinomycetes bacterium]
MILIDAEGLGAARPGRTLFEDLDLTIRTGDRIGVVGINGAGKSTLLGALAGTIEADHGHVRTAREVRIAMLEQAPELRGATMREALHAGDLAADWEVEAVADRLGLGASFDSPLEHLSGGQAKRVSLARALVAEADLLILDEPTNHLDIDAISWLEDRLAGFSGALLLVTHDRHFLDRVTTRILELDRGGSYVHEGGYASWLEARSRRAEQAEASEAKRRNLARSELEWLRRGAPARTSKPKARIEAANRLLEGGPQAAARAGDLPLHAATPRLGDKVVDLHGVGHRYGDHVLFADMELMLDNRERLGVVGPNGTGKSTLLEIMAGRLQPSSGTVELGQTVHAAVFDQQGRDLDESMRVRDAVAGPHGDADWTHAALMEAFWFDSDAQWAPIGTLSGGERRRLQLLLTLAEKPNVLFLDEPTNDLDTETLRQLEDFLDAWPGALVTVSHDRAFLERVVTDVIVLGDGRAARRPGGYAAYEEQRRAARGTTKAGKVAVSGAGTGTPERSTGVRPERARRGESPSGPSPSTLRHRLRAAERELGAQRERCEQLRATLAGGESDHEVLSRLGTELARAEASLEAAEEAWLELADEVESRGLDI